MIARRVGLVLGAVLLIAGLVPALDVEPAPDGRPGDPLALVVAVVSAALVAVFLALLPAAWRGGRRSTVGCAAVLLIGIAPALPAFLLPPDVVPPGGVLAVTVGSLQLVAAAVLVVLEGSSRLLVVAALVAATACFAGGVAALSLVLPSGLDRLGQTTVAVVLAAAFHPALALLRRTVGRSLYGARVTPASTVAELGRRLGAGGAVVAGAIEDARSSLRLPSLALVPAGPGALDPVSVDVPTGGVPLRLRAGPRAGPGCDATSGRPWSWSPSRWGCWSARRSSRPR